MTQHPVLVGARDRSGPEEMQMKKTGDRSSRRRLSRGGRRAARVTTCWALATTAALLPACGDQAPDERAPVGQRSSAITFGSRQVGGTGQIGNIAAAAGGAGNKELVITDPPAGDVSDDFTWVSGQAYNFTLKYQPGATNVDTFT